TPGNTVTNLPPLGTYNIRVGESENDACPAFVQVTINNINTQISFTYTATEASCNGNDGSLTVTSISGGVAPYEISFQGGAFEPFPGNRLYRDIDRGIKSVAIRDNAGCIFNGQGIVPSPNQVVANVYKLADPSCSGDGKDGRIQIIVDRNNTLVAPPYRFGISRELDQENIVLHPLVRDSNDDFVAYLDTLSRGTTYYVYVVSSDNSCPTQLPVTFNNGPIAVDLDIQNVGNIGCKGAFGSLTFGNVSRDTQIQFTVSIYKSGVIAPVFTKNMLNISTSAGYTIAEAEYEFMPGNYQIQISQNQSTCTNAMRSSLKDFTITEPLAALSSRVKNTEISLPDQPTGSIFIDQIRGGIWPYEAKIRLIAPLFQGQEIDRGWTVVNINPNNLEYEIMFNNLYAGKYEVVILDENNCEISREIDIDYDQSLFIPTVFTPNGDDKNETFYIRNLPETGTKLVITNRWGKTVHSVTDYQNDWRGTDLPEGIYYYTLMVTSGKKYNGWVEIWRGPKY
nr:gliding motility-associated C-terminal domain-containing protein [Bacteroidota bacterium]